MENSYISPFTKDSIGYRLTESAMKALKDDYLKTIDTEIVERDNNIPPEESILAKDNVDHNDLYYTFEERRRASWYTGPAFPDSFVEKVMASLEKRWLKKEEK